MLLGVLGHPFQQFTAQILVRHFTATEPQGDLDLVAVFQKLEDVAHLDVIVVGIGVGAELDLFDLDDLLLFAGLGLALLGFVFELAEIHDLAHRRVGVWRDFNQIKPGFLGHHQGAGRRNYADVFTFGADQADFTGSNAFVDAGAGITRGWRVMWSAGYDLYPLIAWCRRKVNVPPHLFNPQNTQVFAQGEWFGPVPAFLSCYNLTYAARGPLGGHAFVKDEGHESISHHCCCRCSGLFWLPVGREREKPGRSIHGRI